MSIKIECQLANQLADIVTRIESRVGYDRKARELTDEDLTVLVKASNMLQERLDKLMVIACQSTKPDLNTK